MTSFYVMLRLLELKLWFDNEKGQTQWKQLRLHEIESICVFKVKKLEGFSHAFALQIDFKRFWRHFLKRTSSVKLRAKKILSNHWSNLIRILDLTDFFNSFQNRQIKKLSADFSVKSSWEVHWIIMFQKDAVWTGHSYTFWSMPI